MRNKVLLLLFALAIGLTGYAQTSLKGRVISNNTQEPVVGAKVTLVNQNISTTTNAAGEFSLIYLEAIDEEIVIEADDYVAALELISLQADQANQMDDIQLQPDIVSQAQDEILLNLTEEEMTDDEGRSQSQASSSSASTDVFNSTTSFAWSTARYRNRGYESNVENYYIEGLNFNTQERGSFNYSAMGGLNDASRYKEVLNPIEASNFTFGGLGQSTNYLMGASRYAQGWKVGLAGTNRNYKARVNATYASGVMSNGWAVIAQLAYRFSPYIDSKGAIGEGIKYYSLGYFLSAEKIWDNKRLKLITFGAPTERGQNAAVTQEVYDLTGTIYYNPYWGYQNGRVRNSRIVKSYDPTILAAFEYDIDDQQKIKVAAGYHYSWYSNSALNFYNAPDPRPDYYRNLPSAMWDGQIANPYYETSGGQLFDENGVHYPWGQFIGEDLKGNPLGGGQIAADGNLVGPSIDIDQYNNLVRLWKNRDNKTTQIDWESLYAANYANNHNNPDGSARYTIERRHNDIQEASASFSYVNTRYDHLKMIAGLEEKSSQGIHYKTIDDLLGGNQWIDIDAFADRDIKELASNSGFTQADIAHVRQNEVREGYDARIADNKRHYGYDYRIDMSNVKAWFQNEWTFNEVDLYYAIALNYSMMQRTTFMLNGRAWYLTKVAEEQKEKDIAAGRNPKIEPWEYYGQASYNKIKNSDEKILKAGRSFSGDAHHFLDPAFKLGATYKINGRNRLKLNAIAETRAPYARDAYISQRVHDRVIETIYHHDDPTKWAAYYQPFYEAAKTAYEAYTGPIAAKQQLKDNVNKYKRLSNPLYQYYAASEKVVSADLTYEFNYPIVRGRLTGFFTQSWDGSELNGYYDDEARTFVNQAMTGIDKRYMGIEAAAAVKLGTYFTLTGAASVGDYRYTSDANSITSAENGMPMTQDLATKELLFETHDRVLLKGLKLSTGPQVNASLKLSFFHSKMWFADVTVSYHDWNYLSVAPSRRMQGLYTGVRPDGTAVNGWFGDYYANAIETTDNQALRVSVDTDPHSATYGQATYENAVLDKNGVPQLKYPFSIMTMQESLAATNPLNRFLIDASVGKLIYLPNRQSLSINLSVTNLTNNTHFKTGGYQQARLPRAVRQGEKDYQNSVITANAWKYPSKYYYAWGANFFLSITYKF
ncbi:MAG: carboxypeptidase-like regulatory domain-containing protein [Paludibacteraceae bacterium]|nr:carboxypeptidase-like regulatory domain-containing protein [Paludibacteraceae bacterium]